MIYFSSPKRALQTAQISLGFPENLIKTNDNLKKINLGSLEGLKLAELSTDQKIVLDKVQKDFSYNNLLINMG